MYNNRLIRDLLWNRLHQPAFSPGFLTEDPIQEFECPLRQKEILWFALMIEFWLNPGCARMPTKAILKEVVHNLDHSADVVKLRTRSVHEVYGYAPEVEALSSYGKRLPTHASLNYPGGKSDRIIDVDGRFLEERETDKQFKVDKDLGKFI